jgi:hypothetical protein
MNKLFLVLILVSPVGYCIEINDFFVQEKKGIIGFTEAISNQKGQVAKQNNDYVITIGNKEYMFDSKFGVNELNSDLNNIFPGHFLVALVFVNVEPKKQIYLDNDHLSNTDDQGNAEKYIYLEKSGSYEIQLKDNKNTIVERNIIDINNIKKVECMGQKPMECKVSIN